MSSIIEGYNYDIFISYRQKDNKGDRWVSEFVDSLKTELESTFKEEISVYFDINQHDGLLETHDVSASLEEKLKCLIFIPVISRTYCDPRSFAWEYEFKAFVEKASRDRFGLKVKLPNGNVATRVLPVRIHDLDNDDIKLCESVTGGFLRGVEFIYKESGVNRPLRSNEDNPHDNLNHTIYRNQINKVALAIKDTVIGLLSASGQLKEEVGYTQRPGTEIARDEPEAKVPKTSKPLLRKAAYLIAGLALVAAAIALFYPKYFSSSTFSKLRLSTDRIVVAVMPFQNLTNDSLLNIWRNGVQDNLITALSNSQDLKVRNREFVNRMLYDEAPADYASMLPSVAKVISQKLNADVYISGSINLSGKTARLNSQLIDSKTDEVFKSFQVDGSSDEMLFVIDSLSQMIIDYLIISKLINALPSYQQYRPLTNSSEAYKCYLLGEHARSKKDYTTALKMFERALSLDSNYLHMTLLISVTYINMGRYKEAREWGDRAYRNAEMLPLSYRLLVNQNHAFFHDTPLEEIKFLRQYLEIDDMYPGTYYDIGLSYSSLYEYEKAIPEFEKALDLYEQINVKPWWVYNYTELGYAYHKTGQYKKEKKVYALAEKTFPDETTLIWRQTILYLTLGDTASANKYLARYRAVYKENRWPEAALARNLGWAYLQANMPDKAEASFREAVALDPGNGFWYYYLAKHLIEEDRNVEEGVELIERALELNPSYEWLFLDTKGWGFYKLGEYEEALRLLERSWELKPTYSHGIYLHLEAARKAVTGQKNI